MTIKKRLMFATFSVRGVRVSPLKVVGNRIADIPFAGAAGGLLATIVTHNPAFVLFSVLTYAIDLVTFLLKKSTRSLMSGSRLGRSIGQRPPLGNPCSRKNLRKSGMRRNACITSKWGLPSGHAARSAFLAGIYSTYMIMAYRNSDDTDDTDDAGELAALVASIVALCVLALLVAIERVVNLRHTTFQVVAGLAIGAAFVVPGYLLVSTIVPDGLPPFVTA